MEWKLIDGFENYEVSNTGIVRNIKTKKIIKPYINKSPKWFKIDNYLKVKLVKNKIPYKFFVHRLVCIAFNPNIYNLETVNHIDFNTMNNNSDNLEWMSRSDNSKYKSGRKYRSWKNEHYKGFNKK
jgi:hypothetical protein